MSLNTIVRQLVTPGKGILAADESTRTIAKRFDAIGVPSTEETRRQYRELLFTTPGIEQYISGVILYDETLRQQTENGIPVPELLESKGIIPGIKVDLGTKPLIPSSLEQITEGLEGLDTRIAEYYGLGARFAKWRAVITIGDGMPSDECIKKNADILATYARICQNGDVVPIVEPEVLMDGKHSSATCFDVTKEVLAAVFLALKKEAVQLGGMLLKPNMVVPGTHSGEPFMAETVAHMTLDCFRETVPQEVLGIVFLSGGQSEKQACETLNAMTHGQQHAWALSFSYGRALQATAMKTWAGKKENIPLAQEAFLQRAKLVSAAQKGEYTKEMEK